MADDGEGFKISSAYVEVGLKDSTGADYQKLKDKLQGEPDVEIATKLGEPDAAKTREEVQAEFAADPVTIPAKIDDKKAADSAKNTGQAAGGLMATAIGLGVVAGGPVVGAAMAGIGTLGLIALGARLQKGDASIHAAWANLVNDAKVSATTYSSVMVEPISKALNQLDANFQRQEPLIQHMFSSAAGDIPIFTNGLTSLVNNALPGFDNALSHSQVIVQGLASLMGSAGGGITDIGNNVASSSGRIGADLADLGNIVHTVETAVGSLVSITSGLAEGALPALSGAVHMVGSTLGGLSSLLGPIEPELGGIAATGGAAWLAFSKLQPVADKLTTSMAGKGGLLGELSGLAGGIPYVGAAVTGLSLVTGILASQNEKAAQAATDEAKSSDNLNHTLGSLTNATQAQIDKAVLANATSQSWLNTGASLQQILSAAGVSQTQFTSAIEGNTGAVTDVKSKLDGYVDSMNKASANGQNVTDQQINQAQGASALSGHIKDLGSAYQGSAAQAAQLAIQTAQVNLGIDHATLNSAQLANDLQVLSTDTSTTTARVSALTDALKLMANGGVEPANDALAQTWSTVNGLGSALQGASGRLLDAAGHLDLTTTRGEQANTSLEQLRNQTAAYAQALSSQGLTSDQVQAKTQAMVNQFIGPLAAALGISRSKAQDLINTYDIIPQTIVTTIGLNANPAYSALNTLLNRISNSSATVAVNIASGAAQHGIQIPQAIGHIVAPMADGAFLDQSLAQVVPPGIPRLVGDAPVPELFAPLNGSQRTKALITQAAQHEGMQAGKTINVNNYITQQPLEDGSVLAARVSAETAWALMTSVGG